MDTRSCRRRHQSRRNHTDCFSCRYGNTANDASTSDDATIPTTLAVGVDTQSRRKYQRHRNHTDCFSWRGGNTANDASTSDNAYHTDCFSWRGGYTELAGWKYSQRRKYQRHRNHTDCFSCRGGYTEPTAQPLQPTTQALQLTAEAISCLYGVGCLYESPIHVHTDCFSWRGGNTANDASTSDNATTPTALAVGVEIQPTTQVPATTHTHRLL